MKRKLRCFCLLLLMGIGMSESLQAQIWAQAANDSIFIATGTPQIAIANVLANDYLNTYDQATNTVTTVPATLANTTFAQLSTDNPSLQLQPDGSVAITSTLPAGLYTLTYQACFVPDFCDTATVAVFINTCQAEKPFANYANPIYCDGTTTMIIENLPSGNWTMRKTKDGVFVADIAGQGTQAQIIIDSPGIYGFQIIDDGNGCMSLKTYREVDSNPCNFDIFYQNITYQDLNANSLVDAGDAINYNFRLQNPTSTTFNTITMASANVNISGGPLAVLPNNSTNSNTFTGMHVITQPEIDAGQVVTHVTASSVTPATTSSKSNTYQFNNSPSVPRGFRLIAFVDSNGDGIKQTSEPILPHAQFQYEVNNDGNLYNLHGGNRIIYENNATNSYDFTCLVLGNYAGYYNVTTAPMQNLTVGTGISIHYFAVTETPFTDILVSLSQSNIAVAGFGYRNVIRYTNASSQPILGNTLNFVKDNAIIINSISQSGTVPNPNGFSYNVVLGAFETRTITVDMTIPAIPAVALGDLITNSATLTVPSGDVLPSNNSDTYTATIVGSYDPNDKTENHNGKIAYADFSADDRLTYTIRFENTGTSPALNIKITDALDSKLDETSVRLVGSSAPCVLDRVNSELTWRFDGINLQPSIVGTQTGHGYVTFEVKPKPGYAVGDIIPNAASIYFDFNPAIVTEPCLTEFVTALRTDEFAANQMIVFPNPTTDVLNIESNGKSLETITIVDLSGKTVLTNSANGTKASVDLSALANGLYLVKVNASDSAQVFKVVKK